MKSVFALCLCLMLLAGCSQQYEIRIVNRSTNDLNMLYITWGNNEVMFPPIASVSAYNGEAYGAPASDVGVYPSCRMPTSDVLIHYLIPGARPVTNSVRVVLPKEVVEAVQESHSNFMFIVNADGTITPTVSAQPR